MNDLNSYTAKPFLQTLTATVEFARLASGLQSAPSISLAARATILHCSFAVEALANNMIQTADLSKRLSETVDRLDIMGKFELCAHLFGRPRMDRGATSFQVLKEFVDLRNRYVHPKITINRFSKDWTSYSDIPEQTYSAIGITTPNCWKREDAYRCVVKLVSSVDELLLDYFQFETVFLSNMLYDRLKIDDMDGPVIPILGDWHIWLESELNCRPMFYIDHVIPYFYKVAVGG